MCGFIGALSPSPFNTDQLSRLRLGSERLSNRGPDGEGEFLSVGQTVYLAHRRLSIIDLNDRSLQPMSSASGESTIVFNGEIYNYLDLRKELENQGVRFRTTSDTEVLIEAIEYWGLSQAINRIDGMFALALFRPRTGTLSIARDRFGEKPLFWQLTSAGLRFASTASALVATLEKKPDIDPLVASWFLKYGFCPGSASIFSSVEKLPQGTFMTFGFKSDNTLECLERGSFGKMATPRKPATIEELEATLEKSVLMRTVSDRPIGLFLSGGLDSSYIASVLAKHNKVLKCYSYSAVSEGFDESDVAAKVAANCGHDFEKVVITPSEMRDIFTELPSIFDEPHADMSSIPLIALSRTASKDLAVVLSGDGGDELFCGYHRHSILPIVAGKAETLPAFFRKIMGKSISSDLFERLASIYYAMFGLAGREQFVRRASKLGAVFSGTDRIDMYLRSISGETGRPQATRTLEGHSPPDVTYFFEDLDLAFYLPSNVLVKTDRCTMASSIEGRTPYLSDELRALARSMPRDTHIGSGQTKKVIRSLLDGQLPQDITKARKRGFDVPIADWVNRSLKAQIDTGVQIMDAIGRLEENLDFRSIEETPVSLYRKSILGHWLKANA